MSTLTATDARAAVSDAIRAIVPDADLDTLEDGELLREAFELDSLDFLSFVEGLSARTGIRIEETDYPRLTTMPDCVDFLTGA